MNFESLAIYAVAATSVFRLALKRQMLGMFFTFTKYFISEGRMRMSGIEEIWRDSGASEKSNGMPSAGGYSG